MTEYTLPEPYCYVWNGAIQAKSPHYSAEQVQAAFAAGLEAGRKVPEVTSEMVSRFLCWPLPADFYPDGGISFTQFTGPADMRYEFKPIGTNLLNADQAREMLEYVLAAAPEPKP